MTSNLKIAIAQINCTVGDLAGNAKKILDFTQQAQAAGADIVVTPELALSGYPPEDLLLRKDFYDACETTLENFIKQVKNITVVVGFPQREGNQHFNAAAVIQNGKMVAVYRKQQLPNYEVFDEERYFEAGQKVCVIEIKGVRIGIAICADVWEGPSVKLTHQAGAQILLILNASPYHINKQDTRYNLLRKHIADTGMAIVYTNLVGGQDELVFDGSSFVLNSRGELTHKLPAFTEKLALVDFENKEPLTGEIAPAQFLEEEIYQALCLGVRDYVGKNGFPGALIGLSGGIDSALTLAIACDALGADKVRAIMMPSDYTADISWLDARDMAKRLGARYSEISITPIFKAYLQTLAQEFKGLASDVAEQNIQARIRGTLLMALSNKFGSIVLTTGNKSEMAVGYATLYGDMAGGFDVLKDISKTLVYRLSRYRNSRSEIIPERILTRAPTAELKPNQTDQDDLPAYEVLDEIMAAYMEHNTSAEEIIRHGYKRSDVKKVVRMIKCSEYKRRQAPLGIRITHRGFGKDWRYPITSKYEEEGGT